MLKVDRAMPHFFELLFLLVQKELKIRYKSSFLGYLWALANPFAFALVYYIAFKVIMRMQMPNYSIFLLTGMFPWVWFANSLVQATGSFRNNASLVKRVNVNRAVLPLSNVTHEMVHFGFAIPVLTAFILFVGGGPHYSWIWQLPMMLLLQFVLAYPLALLFALANVYVHDVEYLVGIGMSLLFFLTPIVYPLDMVPEGYRAIFAWNPLAALIGNWRNLFLEGRLDLDMYLGCLFAGLVFALLSYVAYRKMSIRLGELL